MCWLEVRRHSMTRKGATLGRGSQLSQEGVALARVVGECLGQFAYVVASASPRAIETAIAMGLAVDDTRWWPAYRAPTTNPGPFANCDGARLSFDHDRFVGIQFHRVRR
jgi:hypothetical protein